MYKNRLEPVLEAPVPGIGMTHEVGARPWQQPPQYSNIDDVAQFYMGKMQGDSFAEQTLNLLETKMPVTMIANAMQTTNVMNGVHSIDIGILALPIIMEMIMLVGDSEGIDYVTGIERDIDSEVEDSSIALVLSRIKDSKIDTESEESLIEEPVQEMPIQEEEEDMPTGLMARRV